MRYSVHPPRAFRNRIAKSIGVLVAAALIATLGLPSAAQAQTIANNTANSPTGHGGIHYIDGTGFEITWSTNLATTLSDLNWIVTVTKPNGTKMVVNQHSTVQSTLGAVKTEGDGGAKSLGMVLTDTLTYLATDQGEWWFQVSACTKALAPATDKGICKPSDTEAGDAVGYTHGPPAAPTNLAANAVPSGVALTWKNMASDRAITGYQYAFEMTAAGKPDWKVTSGGAAVIDADDGEHTFMLRAVGSSDNSTATMEDTPVPGEADSVMVTVGDGEEEEEDGEGEPVPTLPEIAALFLGMLLLGSGAYLIRGRQSGGLTNA